MPSETGGTRSRSGGMSVSLSSPDGRVVGGGVAGLLVAASPVQVRGFLHLPALCFKERINMLCCLKNQIMRTKIVELTGM